MAIEPITPSLNHRQAFCTDCGAVIMLDNPLQQCPVCWYIRAEIQHAIKNHAGPR